MRITASVRTGFLALLIVTAIAIPLRAAEVDVKKFDPPKPVAAFALKDHKGRAFGQDDLKDKWTLVVLGYTHCPDVCPFTLNNLALVNEQLKSQLMPGSLPQVVFVGVDPDRDAAVLPDYVPHFDPDFLGVTGDWAEIRKLVETLEGFASIDRKDPKDEGYPVRHSSRVSVIDPKGRIVAQINPPMPPAETAMLIAGLMREQRKGAAAVRPQLSRP